MPCLSISVQELDGMPKPLTGINLCGFTGVNCVATCVCHKNYLIMHVMLCHIMSRHGAMLSTHFKSPRVESGQKHFPQTVPNHRFNAQPLLSCGLSNSVQGAV